MAVKAASGRRKIVITPAQIIISQETRIRYSEYMKTSGTILKLKEENISAGNRRAENKVCLLGELIQSQKKARLQEMHHRRVGFKPLGF